MLTSIQIAMSAIQTDVGLIRTLDEVMDEIYDMAMRLESLNEKYGKKTQSFQGQGIIN